MRLRTSLFISHLKVLLLWCVMMHKPIKINNLGLSFSHKTCFEQFNTIIYPGNRIGIIGRNGCGKSALLKILHGSFKASEGEVIVSNDANLAYVPQIIENFESLSGGERFQSMLTKELSKSPHILLLDEPTNHLDYSRRQRLIRMLNHFDGTLLVVSHDEELLRSCVDTFWHINQDKIDVFKGYYDDYLREMSHCRQALEAELSLISRQKKEMHQSLMKEQKRAASSRARGQKSIETHKWPTIVSKTKALHGEQTSGRKKAQIGSKKQDLINRLSELPIYIPIIPKFSLTSADMSDKCLVSIQNAAIGWHHPLFLRNIYFNLQAGERIAITGDNGSGKSTLIKAILGDVSLITCDSWLVPQQQDIGYLDQHYNTLNAQQSVFESISSLVPSWAYQEVRCHLNDFLFRKNEEVDVLTYLLSGGEKVRLCLAQIAAQTPRLLILDEITNNLDLETKQHVKDVLKDYPGALIVISHDTHFLEAINVQRIFKMSDGLLMDISS